MTDRVAELRRAAGLPERIDDRAVLERVARILAHATPRGGDAK